MDLVSRAAKLGGTKLLEWLRKRQRNVRKLGAGKDALLILIYFNCLCYD